MSSDVKLSTKCQSTRDVLFAAEMWPKRRSNTLELNSQNTLKSTISHIPIDFGSSMKFLKSVDYETCYIWGKLYSDEKLTNFVFKHKRNYSDAGI